MNKLLYRTSQVLAILLLTGCGDAASKYESYSKEAINQLVADLPNISFDEGYKVDVTKTDSVTTPYIARSTVTGSFVELPGTQTWAARIEGFMRFTLLHSYSENEWRHSGLIAQVVGPRMVDYKSKGMTRDEVEERALLTLRVFSQPTEFIDAEDFKRGFTSYKYFETP